METKKKKYWYAAEVQVCFTCGVEKVTWYKVYDKKEKVIMHRETECPQHIMG